MRAPGLASAWFRTNQLADPHAFRERQTKRAFEAYEGAQADRDQPSAEDDDYPEYDFDTPQYSEEDEEVEEEVGCEQLLELFAGDGWVLLCKEGADDAQGIILEQERIEAAHAREKQESFRALFGFAKKK